MEQAVAEFTWDEAEYKRVSRKYGWGWFTRFMLFGAAVFVIGGILLTLLISRAGSVSGCYWRLLHLYAVWFSESSSTDRVAEDAWNQRTAAARVHRRRRRNPYRRKRQVGEVGLLQVRLRA